MVIAQLYILNALRDLRDTTTGSSEQQTKDSRTRKGKILASILITLGIIVAIVGARRYFRMQSALGRGKCVVGGWEVWATGFVTGLVGVGVLVVVVVGR